MKLSEFLVGVGRPVAFYPGLRHLTGSTAATLLLCQLVYWTGKQGDPEGWIYKVATDIEEETGLSYEEQKSARKLLVERGLIEEEYKRLDHRMRFRVMLEKVDSEWNDNNVDSGTRVTPVPEQGNATFGNEVLPCSYNETETTTETTTERADKAQNENVVVDEVMVDEEAETITPIELIFGMGREVKNPAALSALRGSYKNRDAPDVGKFPADVQALAAIFIRESGKVPLGSDIGYWTKGLRRLIEDGLGEREVKEAIVRMRSQGLTIKSPDSVRAIAGDIRDTRQRTGGRRRGMIAPEF